MRSNRGIAPEQPKAPPKHPKYSMRNKKRSGMGTAPSPPKQPKQQSKIPPKQIPPNPADIDIDPQDAAPTVLAAAVVVVLLFWLVSH